MKRVHRESGMIDPTLWTIAACFAGLAYLLANGFLTVAAACGAEPDNNTPLAVLHLANGDYATGRLADSQQPNRLVWQSPAFTQGFEFNLGAVRAVHFRVPGKPLEPAGDYCFQLAGDDILFGSLVSLDDKHAVLETPELGRLHIERAFLYRMYRRGGADLLYAGPGGLNGWKTIGNPGAWQEVAGQVHTDQRGARIQRQFELPAQTCFEIELSWKSPKSDFELALGVDDAQTALHAFRIEVWDDKLVVLRRTEREADVAVLQEIQAGAGRIRLTAFLDQRQERILVFSAEGKQLADLKVAGDQPLVFGGVQLTNRGDDIRLERVCIRRWNGEPPRPVEADKSRIMAADGAIVYGQLKAYDSDKHQFVIEGEAGEQRVDEAQVRDVVLSAVDSHDARSLRLLQLSGGQISGELLKVEQDKIWLKCPGVEEPLGARVESLESLFGSLAKTEEGKVSKDGKGRFELKDTMLHGSLVNGPEANASGLVWQPEYSHSASPLARDVAAHIVYVDRVPAKQVKVNPRNPQLVQQPVQGIVINGVIVRQNARPTPESNVQAPPVEPQGADAKSILHLRSGDTLECMVTGIDEKGIQIESEATDTTFIGHDKVQAIELMPNATPIGIAKSKKERLLTLPRMQRANPPTHLLRSLNGDYLRGRLVGMNQKEVEIEMRLETRTVPRDRVARIIWLHPEGIVPAEPVAVAEAPPVGTRVQGLRSDGSRLTLFAERLDGSNLSGHSDVLGKCQVDLQRLEQLLIGSAINEAASTLAFHDWKLKPASEPLAAPDEAGAKEGQESALIGKPAPDFGLALLDEKRFQLLEHRGKVVVLDFWASWCGPCLQVMPQVDKVAQEFAGQNVTVVAINQQESKAQVEATYERLQLSLVVALDHDGRVGEKYGATLIPQTVVIDREGNVAHVFVGGNPKFEEKLREVVQGLLTDAEKKSD